MIVTRNTPEPQPPPILHTWCCGCEELVPLASVVPHYTNGGMTNTPLCPRCSRTVQCDACWCVVPLGLAWIDRDDAVICRECLGEFTAAAAQGGQS